MHFSRRRCCFNLDTAAKGTGQSCTMPQQSYTARSRANVLEAPNGCVLVAEAATVSGQLCWSCLFDDFSLGGTFCCEMLRGQTSNSEESVLSVRTDRQLAASLDH